MSCSFSPSLLPLVFVLLLSLCSNHHANKQPPNPSMEPSELDTLFKIMETMSSDQSNWRTAHPNPCSPASSWPGIECKLGTDSRFHVMRLDFGAAPNPKCKRNAIFPPLIFELPHLQSVFFFQCFVSTKTFISVSRNRVFSSSLQQLSLRSNPALTGPIPPQISSLRSLQVLTLSQNRLSGQIPIEIFGLTSLVHLDLSYNSLAGKIPDQLGSLGNLVGLDLSYNSLTGSIPDTIGRLSMLQKLDLSSNSLTGVIPETIARLNSLVFMALSNNRLQGKFPRRLSWLQSLEYFIMDDNPMFVPLPEEIGRLRKLQELRLANSGYSGSIPPAYSQLMNLSTLSLQNNRLTGEIPVGLCNLSRIYHLNLSRNLLGGVVPFDAGFLKRLGKNLDLSENPGLCLSPSEAYGVKIGISFCGSKNNGSMIKPIKKSEAPVELLRNRSLLLITVLGVSVLHQIFLLLLK